MTSTRPRRSLQATSYKEMLDSNSEDTESTRSDSELSEASDLGESTLTTQDLFSNVQVVRLPTADDILETQERIRTKTTELAIVEAEYQVMRRNFEVVQAKRKAIERELLEHKAYLAPVRALPQEVLGLVFLFYTNDPSQSPWTLMQITRIWRATALSTRAIWAKIMLTSPAWKTSGASRRIEGREVCGSKGQLDMALRRAGNAALDIIVALTNPHRGGYGREYDRRAIWEMLTHLARSRKCLQVHHLGIKGPCWFGLSWDSYYKPLPFPTSLQLTALKTLCNESSVRPEFMEKILRASKQITDAQIVLHRGVYSPFGIEDLVQCPSTVSLSLDARGVQKGESGYLTMDKMRYALDKASYITTLQLSSFFSDRSTSPPPVLRLPSLHTLTLTAGSEIWSLDAPGLTNLTLSASSFILPGPPGSNHFPLLTSLTVEASASQASPPDYLKHMCFPPLHTLDLCFGKKMHELVGLMAHQADLNPVVVKLRRSVISTTSLTKIMESMSRLEELQIEDVLFTKGFFDFLASRKATSEGSDAFPSDEIKMNCPLLVRLQVDSANGTPVQHKTLRSAAKKAIQARIKAGIVMETCSMRFSEDKGRVGLLP